MSDLTVAGNCNGGTDSSATPTEFKWITAGSEFLYVTSGPGTQSSMGSGHGKPWAVDTSGNRRKLDPATTSRDRAFYAPGFLLVRALADNTIALKYIGSEQRSGRTVTHIQTVQTRTGRAISSTREDWYIDPISYQPVGYVYLLAGQGAENYLAHLYVTYGNFTSYGTFSGPGQIAVSLDDPNGSQNACTVVSAIANTHPDAASFDSTAGVSK